MSHCTLKSAFLVFSLSFILGCQWGGKSQPNVLVIAIEGLDFESMSCLPDITESYPGFAEFCKDSVRFTHAYTPSIMSQAAIASLLTGRYPFEHGVRHNGSDYLREDFETVAEVAYKKDYRTSFFSGGAPIFRKSGFAQGFENFDDNIGVRLNRYYRPAAETIGRFLGWQSRIGDNDPFFSVIYLNDPLYFIVPTKNELGVERSLTRESQLRAVDSALQALVEELKHRKIWHRTNVIVTGLNGHLNRNRPKEIPTTNLYGESTQVVLMMKGAKKNPDDVASWSIDANVSLVDLGVTLFALIGEIDFATSQTEIGSVSLASALDRPKVTWKKDRVVVSETAWAEWREVSGIRYAARKENWLYLFGSPDLYFNTLTDRSEVNPTRVLGEPQLSDAKAIRRLLISTDAPMWSEPADQLVEKLRLGQRWAEQLDFSREEELALRGLLKESPWDKEITGWLWDSFERREDFEALEGLASAGSLEPIWRESLLRTQKRDGQQDDLKDSCRSVIENQVRGDTIAKCRYELLRGFGILRLAEGTSEESRATNRFLKLFQNKLIDSFIRRLNYLNGTIFDSEIRADLEVPLMNLILKIPEMKKYRALVQNSFGQSGFGAIKAED